MKFSYYVRKEERADGTHDVLMVITANRTRARISTGLSVFNAPNSLNEFPSYEPDGRSKTAFLDDLLLYARSLLNANPSISVPEAKERIQYRLLGYKPGNSGTPLVQVVEKVADTKNEKSRQMYMYTARKVADFAPDVLIEEVDKRWLERFDAFCAKTMSVNGRSLHHRNLRAVMNWCIDEEILGKNPYAKFKIRKEQTRKRSLTIEQLRAIRDCKCEEWQEIYRDLFLLMFCLIGINSKDLLQLKRTNLVNGRIEYRRAKTKKLFSVKVEPEASAIIDKYAGRDYLLCPLDTYKDYLDFLSHWNKALKNLGRAWHSGARWTGEPIVEGLSTYWSRHTWATMAIDLDVPVDVVGHALGHSLPMFSVTEIYINRNQRKVDEANRKVIDYLFAD